MSAHSNLRFPILTVLFLIVAFSAKSPAEEPKPKEATVKSDSNAMRRPKITISKETTYITEPLRADGYPDYVAAINQRCSQGVTPENNAAISLWKAMGTKSIDKKIRKRYFEMLGIPELPEEGDYLVEFDDFLSKCKGWKPTEGDTPEQNAAGEEALKEYRLARQAPWSRDDHPTLAALLEKNEKSLQLIVEGAQRPRLFSPTVSLDEVSILPCNLGGIAMQLRDPIRQLAARAMLRLHQGRTQEAWNDTFACHRLARLTGQGPLLIDALIAVTYEAMASSGTVAFAQHAGVTTEQARQWQAELRNLPARPTMREYWDHGERLYGFSEVLDVALHGYQEPSEVDLGVPLTAELLELIGQTKAQVKAGRLFSDDPRIDWDEVFRHSNQCYDQLVSALGEPTRTLQDEAFNRLSSDRERLYTRAMEKASNCDTLPADMTPKSIAQHFGDLRWQGVFGATGASLVCEFRSNVYAAFPALALALAGYRHDHGEYPKTLAELRPTYIPEIPKDPCSDGDLQYKPEGDGYVLYSVGPNGKDDGGRNFNDEYKNYSEYESATEEEKARDDIAIRTPPKEDHGK
jgi:hypothetical protein